MDVVARCKFSGMMPIEIVFLAEEKFVVVAYGNITGVYESTSFGSMFLDTNQAVFKQDEHTELVVYKQINNLKDFPLLLQWLKDSGLELPTAALEEEKETT